MGSIPVAGAKQKGSHSAPFLLGIPNGRENPVQVAGKSAHLHFLGAT